MQSFDFCSHCVGKYNTESDLLARFFAAIEIDYYFSASRQPIPLLISKESSHKVNSYKGRERVMVSDSSELAGREIKEVLPHLNLITFAGLPCLQFY